MRLIVGKTAGRSQSISAASLSAAAPVRAFDVVRESQAGRADPLRPRHRGRSRAPRWPQSADRRQDAAIEDVVAICPAGLATTGEVAVTLLDAQQAVWIVSGLRIARGV